MTNTSHNYIGLLHETAWIIAMETDS